MAESLSGAGGIGVEDLTAGLDKASKLTTNKDALARLVQEGQEKCRVIGEESELLINYLVLCQKAAAKLSRPPKPPLQKFYPRQLKPRLT